MRSKLPIHLTLSSDVGGEAEAVQHHLDGVMADPTVVPRDVGDREDIVPKGIHMKTMLLEGLTNLGLAAG